MCDLWKMWLIINKPNKMLKLADKSGLLFLFFRWWETK